MKQECNLQSIMYAAMATVRTALGRGDVLMAVVMLDVVGPMVEMAMDDASIDKGFLVLESDEFRNMMNEKFKMYMDVLKTEKNEIGGYL